MVNNIYIKLQKVQEKISELEKNELNKFQNYKYVDEYSILRSIRPLLAEQKLTLTFEDEIIFNKDSEGNLLLDNNNVSNLSWKKEEKDWVVKYLKKAVLTNSEKPEEQINYRFWALGANQDPAKAKGSAETYAVKYFLQKLFLIPTSDKLDPDSKDVVKSDKFAPNNQQRK